MNKFKNILIINFIHADLTQMTHAEIVELGLEPVSWNGEDEENIESVRYI